MAVTAVLWLLQWCEQSFVDCYDGQSSRSSQSSIYLHPYHSILSQAWLSDCIVWQTVCLSEMTSCHRPRIYRSNDGCCICGAKSSSSRFTASTRYESFFERCFALSADERRSGDICNACVLLVKRFRKLPSGSTRCWAHVCIARQWFVIISVKCHQIDTCSSKPLYGLLYSEFTQFWLQTLDRQYTLFQCLKIIFSTVWDHGTFVTLRFLCAFRKCSYLLAYLLSYTRLLAC